MISAEELNSLLTIMRQHGCTLLEHDGLRIVAQPMQTGGGLVPDIPLETAHSGIRRLNIAEKKAALKDGGW